MVCGSVYVHLVYWCRLSAACRSASPQRVRRQPRDDPQAPYDAKKTSQDSAQVKPRSGSQVFIADGFRTCVLLAGSRHVLEWESDLVCCGIELCRVLRFCSDTQNSYSFRSKCKSLCGGIRKLQNDFDLTSDYRWLLWYFTL